MNIEVLLRVSFKGKMKMLIERKITNSEKIKRYMKSTKKTRMKQRRGDRGGSGREVQEQEQEEK